MGCPVTLYMVGHSSSSLLLGVMGGNAAVNSLRDSHFQHHFHRPLHSMCNIENMLKLLY